jgi:hypothetical protein
LKKAWLKKVWIALWSAVREIGLSDLLLVLGFASLIYGVAKVNQAAAFIVAGALLMYVSINKMRKESPRGPAR